MLRYGTLLVAMIPASRVDAVVCKAEDGIDNDDGSRAGAGCRRSESGPVRRVSTTPPVDSMLIFFFAVTFLAVELSTLCFVENFISVT